MTIDIEQLRKDMKAGTPGPWFALPVHGAREQTNFARVFAADDDLRYVADCCDSLNFHSKTDNETNARRIARVPDMEAHILADAEALKAADELALVVSGLLDVMQPHKMEMVVESALAAYRKARGET